MLNATAISLYVACNRMCLLCLTIKCLSILRRISAGESRWVTLHFTCFFGNTLPVTLKTFASELYKGRQRDMIRWLNRADVLLLVLLHAAGKTGWNNLYKTAFQWLTEALPEDSGFIEMFTGCSGLDIWGKIRAAKWENMGRSTDWVQVKWATLA